MLDHARGSQGLSLDDSVLEGGPDRVFRLRPRLAVLGQIKEAQVYRFKMVLSNCGNQIARFRIRQPENDSVSIIYAPGGVAAGMSVVLEVDLFVCLHFCRRACARACVHACVTCVRARMCIVPARAAS